MPDYNNTLLPFIVTRPATLFWSSQNSVSSRLFYWSNVKERKIMQWNAIWDQNT